MTLQAAGGIDLGSAHISAGSLLDIGTAGTVAGAGGDVTQAAGGVLNAASLVSSLGIAGTLALLGSNSIAALGGVAASAGVTLGAGNTVNTIGNVTATGGDVVLADAAPVVTLDGTIQGNNLLIVAASAGGTLSLGSPAVAGPPAIPASPASLTLNGSGRISLVADNLAEVAGSTLNSPATVEIAPFSSIAETLNVASGTGTFGVDSTLLSQIGSANTLVIGRVTPLTALGLGTVTADGVSIAGAVESHRHRRGARPRQQQRREPGRRRHAHRRHAGEQRRRRRHGQPRRHQERDRDTRDVRCHRRRSCRRRHRHDDGQRAGDGDERDAVRPAGSLAIDAAVQATGTLALGSAGTVSEGVGGSVQAGTLTSHGTIGGDLALSGSNTIGALGGIAVAGSVAITDAPTADLTVAGPVSAGTTALASNAQSLALHVTNGATIDLPTGGSLLGGNITLTAGGVTEFGRRGADQDAASGRHLHRLAAAGQHE